MTGPRAREVFIKFPCATCSTLLDAPRDQVGQQVVCPDCGRPTVVPAAPPDPPRFQPADASDVVLDEPPTVIDETRKRIAGRLMQEAEQHVQQREEAEPPQPIRPMRSGILSFPFHLEIIPVWVALSVGVLAILGLLDVIQSMTRVLSIEAILAVFVSLITIFFAALLAGFCLPPLLAVIEFTADGQDHIPYWPSNDLLDRGRVLLFFVNSLSVSSLPGMLVATSLQSLGVPLWTGMLLTPVLWPIVLLSMLEANSPFVPFSARVRTSLRQLRPAWLTYYAETLGLAIALVIPFLLLLWVSRPYAARICAVVAGCYFAIVCCRLLGRLAWMAGQIEIEEDWEDDEEEIEDQEDDEDGLDDEEDREQMARPKN